MRLECVDVGAQDGREVGVDRDGVSSWDGSNGGSERRGEGDLSETDVLGDLADEALVFREGPGVEKADGDGSQALGVLEFELLADVLGVCVHVQRNVSKVRLRAQKSRLSTHQAS